MKRSVILTDRLVPDILSAFWKKGQVLDRERAHLKDKNVGNFLVKSTFKIIEKPGTFKCAWSIYIINSVDKPNFRVNSTWVILNGVLNSVQVG